MKKLLLTLLVATVVISCTTVGNKFNPEDVNKLTPGVSTLAEATEILGPPMSTSALPDGNMLYQWQYAQGTALGAGSGAHLAIAFDQSNTMIKVTHMSSTGIR